MNEMGNFPEFHSERSNFLQNRHFSRPFETDIGKVHNNSEELTGMNSQHESRLKIDNVLSYTYTLDIQ